MPDRAIKPVNAQFLEKRLPIWKALSDLFLDTELRESDYRAIAEQIKASGYSNQEIEDILWHEVFPALADNLRIVAGEWAGFSEKWLQDRILNVMSGRKKGPGFLGLTTVKQARKIVDQSWQEVQRHLTEGSS